MLSPPSADLQAARAALLAHPLLHELTCAARWRIFMQHHVFAVWNFMSLVKRLQRDLTCVTLPWLPPRVPGSARFINEVVLAEESDADGRGGTISHFELYCQAMREVGADLHPIQSFLGALQRGIPVATALQATELPAGVSTFVAGDLQVAQHGSLAEACAVFFWGREALIPALFSGLVRLLPEDDVGGFTHLRYYLQRHIAIDGDEHGPMAEKMLASLTTDPADAAAAERAGCHALRRRHALWTAIARAAAHEAS